jgi:hypothetical protein
MLKRSAALCFATCVLAGLWLCSSAMASDSGWDVVGFFAPTNLAPGGNGTLELYVYDPSPRNKFGEVLTDTLPSGVVATDGSPNCSGTTVVTCELEELGAGEPLAIGIPVTVDPGVRVGSEGVDRVTVSGGGVAPASDSIPVKFSSTPAEPGFSLFDGWFSTSEGLIDTQAGSHPFQMTLAFAFNNDGSEPAGGGPRGLNVDLPPGLLTDTDAVPQCERAQLDTETTEPYKQGECPLSTVVGEETMVLAGREPVTVPVYNMAPPVGAAAELGFTVLSTHVLIDASVPGGSAGAGLVEHFDMLPQADVLFDALTLWGTPDEETVGNSLHPRRGGQPSDAPLASFLTLPTSCGPKPLEFSASMAGTWENPDTSVTADFGVHDSQHVPVGLSGCGQLGFAPTVTAAPDTAHADTPAGFTVQLAEPQEGLSTTGILTVSDLGDTTVALPPGMAVNPGRLAGLEACQPAEAGLGSEAPPSCPAASVIGEAEIETPLVKNPLKGSVYVLASSPPAIELLVAVVGEGVNLKFPATLRLNEATGQMTLALDETPELALASLKISFAGGAHAAFVTPLTCGVYTMGTDFSPASSPFVEDVLRTDSFAVQSGPGSAPCGAPSFDPVMTAGSSTDQAGGYGSFSVLLEREDGQQRISSLQFKLPPGLLGMIGGVSLCGEPQAAEGSCPQASQIGHAVLGAGPGPYPLFIPQPGKPAPAIYLTGPYQGAPYGLSIVLPLQAGPFDLGTRVIRAGVEVDPQTGQLVVTLGALPDVVEGIPLDLRTISMILNRPEFIFNPTDCAPADVSGSVSSVEGVTAAVETHFQLGSCQALKFGPHLELSTRAKTSKTEGASLAAKLSYPAEAPAVNEAESQANIQALKLQLPKQLTLRHATLAGDCSTQIFQGNPASCPAGSVVGHATALTPVFEGVLSGPVYLVARAGQALPSLELVLQGAGITLEVTGSLASKAGVSTGAFEQIPDMPFSSLEIAFPEGQHSLLVANGSLCKTKLAVAGELVAQNGAVLKQSTKLVVNGCMKSEVKHKKKSKGRKRTKAKRQGREHKRGAA